MYNPTLRGSTSGSVRENLTYDLLEDLKIPLPDIAIQQAIVNDWKALQEEKRQLFLRQQAFDVRFNGLIVK